MFIGTSHRSYVRSFVAALVGFSLASAPSACQSGAIYVLVDHLGHTLYTDRPDRYPDYTRLTGQSARATLKRSSRRPSKKSRGRTDIDQLIAVTATRNELDSALLKAVVHAESSFNPRAQSRRGALGLMQLMPRTAKHYGVRNAFDPKQNLTGGARHLRNLLNRFNGNETLALAAYNAGETAVKRHGGIPPYAETRAYVRRIQRLRRTYQQQQ